MCACVCTMPLAQEGWDAENEIRLLDNFKVPDILLAWSNCFLTLLPMSLVSSDIAFGFISRVSFLPAHHPNGFHK